MGGQSGHRFPPGSAHPNARLTQREVDLMRALYSNGFGYKRLSYKFEISKTQVRRIVAWVNWL